MRGSTFTGDHGCGQFQSFEGSDPVTVARGEEVCAPEDTSVLAMSAPFGIQVASATSFSTQFHHEVDIPWVDDWLPIEQTAIDQAFASLAPRLPQWREPHLSSLGTSLLRSSSTPRAGRQTAGNSAPAEQFAAGRVERHVGHHRLALGGRVEVARYAGLEMVVHRLFGVAGQLLDPGDVVLHQDRIVEGSEPALARACRPACHPAKPGPTGR